MHSCIFEHGRGVTPVIHVLLRALSLPMDHCQPQAQPLGVGLGPARQKQPLRKLLAEAASQPTTASLSHTNSKQRLHLCGCFSARNLTGSDSLFLINIPKPTLPLAPPQALLCSSTLEMLSEMVRHC